MAEATRTEVFDIPMEKFFASVTDYKSYPDLVPMVVGIKVLSDDGNKKRVQYELNIMKKFTYTLDLTEDAPRKLSWELVESSLFKQMSGFWEFEQEDGKTKVTYHTEVSLPRLAPRSMVDKLVGSTLPGMMKSFADHAKSL